MTTAILIDLDFFIRRYKNFYPELAKFAPTKQAAIIAKAIQAHSNNHMHYENNQKRKKVRNRGKENIKNDSSPCSNTNNRLLRIYIYDCPPLEKRGIHHPKTGKTVDLSKTDVAIFRNTLHNEIKNMPLTALRLGKLDEKNIRWIISNEKKYKKLLRGEITIDDIEENEFKIDVQQKQVDMKIGIDITWLALKKLVDQIVLVSGDSDFVPVAKLARKEGITFILDAMHHKLTPDLLEHIDFLRTPKLPAPDRLA